MKIFIISAFGVIGLVLSAFFVYYGIKGGLIDKRILSDFSNHYATGREAAQRGIFYVLLGLFFLIGSIVTLLSVYKRLFH